MIRHHDFRAFLTDPIALVGATNDNKSHPLWLLLDLEKVGFTIYPISKDERTIANQPASPSLESARPVPHTVVFGYDHPDHEENILIHLHAMRDIGANRAAFFESAFTPAVQKFCEECVFDVFVGNLREEVKK